MGKYLDIFRGAEQPHGSYDKTTLTTKHIRARVTGLQSTTSNMSLVVYVVSVVRSMNSNAAALIWLISRTGSKLSRTLGVSSLGGESKPKHWLGRQPICSDWRPSGRGRPRTIAASLDTI
jgi:hypothetical protein